MKLVDGETGGLPRMSPASQKPAATPDTVLKPPSREYKLQLVWGNIIFFAYMHSAALYGLYLLFTKAKAATICWFLFAHCYSGFGLTAGAHRLWSHKSYKATLPLRILLAFCHTSSFAYSIYKWSRDHRLHHKFTDTDADPNNTKRGFFFAHIGWLLVRKHEDVKTKGKIIDMSDLEKDAVVMWQHRLYPILMPLCTFIIPSLVPWYFWGEDGSIAWHTNALRYLTVIHSAFLINSVAHYWGMKPYDNSISPTQNVYVGIISYGEGWHNYHHAFPWDYKSSEISGYRTNATSLFIDFFAKIGWAYDLKTADPEMIVQRAKRTGDGTHPKLATKT